MQRWLVLALAPAAAALLPSPLARSRGVVRLARAAAPRLAARFAVGVDVGTGSARAGVVDVSTGELCGVHKQDILLFNPLPDFYEQSSDDIWSAVCTCVKGALAAAGASPDDVCGVAFDATCSLVVLDGEGQPVGVDPTVPDDAARNVIVWMDHRAEEQASRINALGHPRLANVGGAISPEMEIPKLLWLKENLPRTFQASAGAGAKGKALDLSDFLAYKAVDGKGHARSLCTTVCKWNYDASPSTSQWDRSFFALVGFEESELAETCIGEQVLAPGDLMPGGGVGPTAALALGLNPGTPVGIGMIDAHAGGIGCLGASVGGPIQGKDASTKEETVGDATKEPAVGGSTKELAIEGRLGLIAGTSTCHMASSALPCFVPGVWGPYFSAMFPELYLNEGGQSAAGAMLDFLIASHPAGAAVTAAALAAKEPRGATLNRRLARLAEYRGVPVPTLAREMHVTPDVNGNRLYAEPGMRGGVVGIGLAAGEDELAVLYLAAVQSLAYQTRQIVETMEEAGHPPIRSVFVCGGLSKNPLYVSSHADAMRLPHHLPTNEEAVLLGAAILAATAGGAYPSVGYAAAAMTSVKETIYPSEDEQVLVYHEKKYRAFCRMTDDQREYRRLME